MDAKQQISDRSSGEAIEAAIDQYLEPLKDIDPDDSIAIARFLALHMYKLEVGIEQLRADVRQLAACVPRTN